MTVSVPDSDFDQTVPTRMSSSDSDVRQTVSVLTRMSARRSLCPFGCAPESQCVDSEIRQTVSDGAGLGFPPDIADSDVLQRKSVPGVPTVTRISAIQSMCRLGCLPDGHCVNLCQFGCAPESQCADSEIRQTVSDGAGLGSSSTRHCRLGCRRTRISVRKVSTRMSARRSVCRRLGCPPDGQCADSDVRQTVSHCVSTRMSARQSVCRLGCPPDSQCADSEIRQTVSVPIQASMITRQSVCRLGYHVTVTWNLDPDDKFSCFGIY